MSNSKLIGQKVMEGGYQVVEWIAEGVYGQVYKVKECSTGKVYAAKIARCSKVNKSIQWEAQFLQKLKSKTSVSNFVGCQKRERIDDNWYNILVVDLLGDTLEKHLRINQKVFDLETVLHIGFQLIEII